MSPGQNIAPFRTMCNKRSLIRHMIATATAQWRGWYSETDRHPGAEEAPHVRSRLHFEFPRFPGYIS